jgi:hypothetical protein
MSEFLLEFIFGYLIWLPVAGIAALLLPKPRRSRPRVRRRTSGQRPEDLQSPENHVRS